MDRGNVNLSVNFTLGDVRLPHDPDRRAQHQYRVFAMDEHEVFFDTFWPAMQKWSFGTKGRKCYYYRDYADRFFRESDHVRHQPLTEEEFALFRPDLPMRLLRNTALSWGFAGEVERPEFERRLCANGFELHNATELAVAKVVLIAAPLKASSRGEICVAENKRAFSSGELLWHANRIHLARGCAKKPGIGLFRLGHQNGGIPSFLVGGFDEIPLAQSVH